VEAALAPATEPSKNRHGVFTRRLVAHPQDTDGFSNHEAGDKLMGKLRRSGFDSRCCLNETLLVHPGDGVVSEQSCDDGIVLGRMMLHPRV
jgi:hypothetical protein